MTKDQAEKRLYAYINSEVEHRVREVHADIVAECASLQRQLQDAEAVQLRLVQERDAARDEGILLVRELRNVRDELDRAINELEFHRTDSGYWKGMYERERRLRLDERQQLMEEGGIDHFWAMMSRVMQADANTIANQSTNRATGTPATGYPF